MKYVKYILPLLMLVLTTTASAQMGNLQRSEKKTLFVFPVEFDGKKMDVPKGEVKWAREQFLEMYVNTFERFDYVEMPELQDRDSFLNDAKTYIEEHAREIVQKHKEPDGRIREVRVTVDDLKEAVQNGYVFFPEVTHVKKNKQKKKNASDEISFDVEAHIDVYRAINGEKIETVNGSSDSPAAVLGHFRALATGFSELAGADKTEKAFRNAVNGVYEEMKVYLRQMDEFQLKAVAFDTDFNGFNIDLGKTMGIRKDRRYKAWSLDNDGKPNEMLAFGKVRRIEEDYSRVQILIGSVGEGDQVLEDARFGLNIAPQFMILPWKLEGFDDMNSLFINILDPNVVFSLPDDAEGTNISLGLSMEYNIGWITNVSELYIVMEGGWIPNADMMVWNGMFGLRKKAYFRRMGVFGTVKVGGIGVDFMDTDMFDDPDVEEGSDATAIGVGVDVGGEVLITPNLALRSQIGYYGFPKQTVLMGYDTGDGEWKSAYLTSAGVTFGIALSYTL